MASFMVCLTRHSHQPSGLGSLSRQHSLSISVLQRQKPQYLFFKPTLCFSFFFISAITFSSFSHTSRTSESCFSPHFSCSRFCQISFTNTSKQELDQTFFRLHWMSYRKKTQLTIFFCQLDSLLYFDIKIASDRLALGEATGEKLIRLVICLKLGLLYGSTCNILDRIFCIFLDTSTSFGKDKGFLQIQVQREFIDLEDQGQQPTKVQQTTTPRDQTSALREYSCPLSTSGAMQAGLPMKLQVVSPLQSKRLKPQSATLILPFLKRMLAGLMSLWMIPLLQAWHIASRICRKSGKKPAYLRAIRSQRVPPSQYSQTKQTSCLSTISQTSCMTWGCLNSESTSISLSSRCLSFQFLANLLRRMALMATASCPSPTLPLQTLPNWPSPMSSPSQYQHLLPLILLLACSIQIQLDAQYQLQSHSKHHISAQVARLSRSCPASTCQCGSASARSPLCSCSATAQTAACP